MQALRVRVALIAVVLLALGGLVAQNQRTTTVEASTAPPAAVAQALDPSPADGVDLAPVALWLEGVRQAEAKAYLDAVRAQRVQEEREKAAAARAARAASSQRRFAQEMGNGRCGGDLPPCWVMMRESGGDPQAWNPTGCYEKRTGKRGCGGKWQFSWSTWAQYGGYDTANLAPEELQDERARQVWAGGAGCSHWAAC